MITLTEKEFEQAKKSYRRLNLIKTDKNGSQYYEGLCPCPRCNGQGIYYTHVLNGNLIPATPESGRCFKCGGQRVVQDKVKVITEEYAKILEAKRIDKQVKSVEEANRRLEETRQYRIKSNQELGFKEVDFKLADWFTPGQIPMFKMYRIAHETEKAYLLRLTNFLDIDESNMHDAWVPKKAITFNKKEKVVKMDKFPEGQVLTEQPKAQETKKEEPQETKKEEKSWDDWAYYEPYVTGRYNGD